MVLTSHNVRWRRSERHATSRERLTYSKRFVSFSIKRSSKKGIFNCVSMIRKLCHSGMVTIRFNTRPADSLFTESPPFLHDMIFISKAHRYFLCLICFQMKYWDFSVKSKSILLQVATSEDTIYIFSLWKTDFLLILGYKCCPQRFWMGRKLMRAIRFCTVQLCDRCDYLQSPFGLMYKDKSSLVRYKLIRCKQRQ